MEDRIYQGSHTCSICGKTHNYVRVNDSTVIKEFSYNYYLPNTGCAWSEDERYCVLARWDDFRQNPNMWIDKAYEKRTDPIAAKTKVRP
jgi:hypothetical protein